MDAMNVMKEELKRAPKAIQQRIYGKVNFDLIQENKYDKYGDGGYIAVETVTDLLNAIFGCVWSWEIVQFFHNGKDEGKEYVVCHGRLTVPGIGVRDGIGQAAAAGGNKDNSTMYSAAASFALKAAAKRLGIAPNIFNKDSFYQEGGRIPVFEPGQMFDPVETANATSVNVRTTTTADGPIKIDAFAHNGVQMTPESAAEEAVVIDTSDPALDVSNGFGMAQAEAAASIPETPKSQAVKHEAVTAKEKGAELRAAYGINTREQFVAFAQIWNPTIQAFEDITEQMIHDLHTYVDENAVEFEDFVATDY